MAESSRKYVSVGCKLPNGIILEMDYEIVNGNVIRGEKYQRVELAGANQHSIVTGDLRTPSPKDLRPGITDNVDEAFFDAWMKLHSSLSCVKNGLIFKAPNKGEAIARAADETQKKTGMEPVDPTKVKGVEKRTDD